MGIYEDMWKQIVMQKKCDYSLESLGETLQIIEGEEVWREDFEVTSSEGHVLQCSLYRPLDFKPFPGTPINNVIVQPPNLSSTTNPTIVNVLTPNLSTPQPLSPPPPQPAMDLVVYFHARGGARIEGLFLVKTLLPRCLVLLFDFAGSGLSGGDFITLGLRESIDAHMVLSHLKSRYPIRKVGIWGRSMGAVTAILYAEQHPEMPLAALILDSPFSSYKDMIFDIIRSKYSVPKCFIKAGAGIVNSTIKQRTGADLTRLKPIKSIKNVHAPIFMMVGISDIIARPDRVKDLYNAAASEFKEFHLFPGEHASSRGQKVNVTALYFLLRQLTPDPVDALIKRNVLEQ